jgi:FtsH-binding integral membrane protein
MGGDNKSVQYDEDSYILAAINLYLDIINIFLYLLQILSDANNNWASIDIKNVYICI